MILYLSGEFKMKTKDKTITYIGSFILPVTICLLVMYKLCITPFGDTSVFIWDAKLQHKDYLGYVWDILHGNESIEYFAGKSLGGRIIGILGFYSSSPLNLLLFFFSKDQIPLFMALVILLRIGLAGLTSQFFLRDAFKISSFPSILFSTSYALMEYNVYYCRNVMWLDGVILLPLAAAGIVRLIKKDNPTLLWLSVVFCIISNWYSGYMVCLFIGIFYIYEVLLENTEGSSNFNFKKLISRNTIQKFIKFVIIMLTGVLSSMIILLPACMSLLGGKATHNSIGLTGNIHFDLLHFFSGFEIDAAVNKQTAPVIFCGTILLILSFYYFLSKKTNKAQKIISGLFTIFIIASFCFQDIELIWTAFVKSNSYFFRFSFIVPFFMLILSAQSWLSMEKKGLSISGLILSVICITLIFDMLFRNDELMSSDIILSCSLIILILTSLFLGIYHINKVTYVLSLFGLYAISVTELGYNTFKAFSDYSESASIYSDYIKKMEPIISKLQSEKGFFRFEKNDSYLTLIEPSSSVATCESMLLGYNSIEHYSSAYDEKVDEFLALMGYSDLTDDFIFRTETYWNSPMVAMDSLLSIKYAVLSDDTYGYEINSSLHDLPFGGKKIYRNKYALPLGYNIKNDGSTLKWSKNPYKNQNEFFKIISGVDDVYDILDTSNTRQVEHDEIIEITASMDGPLYLYLFSSDSHRDLYKNNCSIYVNGKYIQDSCRRFLINSIWLGDYKTGDRIEICIKHNSNDLKPHTAYVAQLNISHFENAIKNLCHGYTSNLTVAKNQIYGSYKTDRDSTIMITIPYEMGAWTAYVDGKKTELAKIADTFIGIKVDKGIHEIRLVYRTPGLMIGTIISICSTGAFIVYLVRKKCRK